MKSGLVGSSTKPHQGCSVCPSVAARPASHSSPAQHYSRDAAMLVQSYVEPYLDLWKLFLSCPKVNARSFQSSDHVEVVQLAVAVIAITAALTLALLGPGQLGL